MTLIPYDIKRAKFLGDSFNVFNQEVSPQSVAFSNDGLKLFVVGFGAEAVLEYNLTIAFDVTTASFSGNSLPVIPQLAFPTSIFFSPSGLKMYVIGVSSEVFEYDLTNAFDLITASLSGNSFDVSSELSNPISLSFSNDGFKMFVTSGNSIIHQYNLSISFDLSTASFSGNTFGVFDQESVTESMSFSSDGLLMFIVGNSTGSVHKYALTVPFDITTISFTGESFKAFDLPISLKSVKFSADGLGMFIIQGSIIFSYNIASFFTKSFSIDTIPVKLFTKLHTISSQLQKKFTKTFSIDSSLLDVFTKPFLVDSHVRETFTKLFSINSIFKKNSLKPFLINGVIKKISTKLILINSSLQRINTKSFFINSALQIVKTKEFSIGSIPTELEIKIFGINGILKTTFLKDFLINSILVIIRTKTFFIDSTIGKINTKNYLINSLIRLINKKLFSINSIIVTTSTKSFLSDASLDTLFTKIFSINSIFKKTITKLY